MMKNLIFTIVLVYISACTQEQGNVASPSNNAVQNPLVPVSVHGGYSMPSLLEQALPTPAINKLDSLLTKKWYAEFTVFDTAKPDVTLVLSTCNDYLPYGKQTLNTKLERDNAAFMEITVMCKATAKITRAAPSKVSYLSNLKLDKSLPDVLPADVAMIISESERTRILSDSSVKTWSQASQITRYESSNPHHASYHTDGGMQDIELVATGDFNGDGIEDMMITTRDSVTQGSYSAIRLFTLTRKSKDGPIQLIK